MSVVGRPKVKRLTLVLVGIFGESGVLMVGCGNDNTMAVKEEGGLW